MSSRNRSSRRRNYREQPERSLRQSIMPLLKIVAVVALISAALRLEHQSRKRMEAVGGARVIDGDSLVVDGVEVRMKNIDAPEGRQTCRRGGTDWRCGEEAARQLRRLAAGRVTCRGNKRDKYERLLGICTGEDGRELNRAMVAEGWAVSFGDYRAEEVAAKRERKGIWASEFERPSEWRAKNNI